MPWKEVTVMKSKQAFIEAAQKPRRNISALCREHGISRKTGYKLLKQYAAITNADKNISIKPISCRPLNTPTETEDYIKELILFVRDTYPRWGSVKIKQYLIKRGILNMPSDKTVQRILKRYGRISEEASNKSKPFIRFEHEAPNDLWQMDFKGHFETKTARCYPLTLLDDHSRFSLLIKACPDQQHETVKRALIDLFRQYGLPKRMTMDNGLPWGLSGDHNHTRLTAWLIQLGITVSHSRPYHPQTQGKLERFHRSMKEELLSIYSFNDLRHAQEGFDYWRAIYNKDRPHSGINLGVPIERYKPSNIGYPEVMPKIEYEAGALVKRVSKKGLIFLDGRRYRVGEAFQTLPIALEETEESNIMTVKFCHQKVLKIDLNHEAS